VLFGNDDAAKAMRTRIRKANELRNLLVHRHVVWLDPDQRTFRFEPPDERYAVVAVPDLQQHVDTVHQLVRDLIEEAVLRIHVARVESERAMKQALLDYLSSEEHEE
jgi:hypothetical protein